MTERLTKKYDDNSIYGTDGCMSGCDTCSWCECKYVHKMIEKLSYFEDLQEQGRLAVLPEGFDKKRLISFIAYDYCISLFHLKELCEDKNVSHKECEECWEIALKGGAENDSRRNDGEASKA